ncbi:MAG TPA: hypothetical protein VJ343_01105 [archaeon]|nr:hypothetical protein [archaeon]
MKTVQLILDKYIDRSVHKVGALYGEKAHAHNADCLTLGCSYDLFLDMLG